MSKKLYKLTKANVFFCYFKVIHQQEAVKKTCKWENCTNSLVYLNEIYLPVIQSE